MGLALARENTVEININPGGVANWVDLACGFENIGLNATEVLNQGYYLCDGGFGHTDVTAMQLVLPLTGKRIKGDPAQGYIFSNSIKFSFGVVS